MEKFTSFYNKYKDRLFSYLLKITGDYCLAADIMQESFTRYLERYGKNSESAALLYTIGRNLIYDNARKQKRNARLQSDPDNPIDDSEHYLMVREEYRQVLSAMQTLEAADRPKVIGFEIGRAAVHLTRVLSDPRAGNVVLPFAKFLRP